MSARPRHAIAILLGVTCVALCAVMVRKATMSQATGPVGAHGQVAGPAVVKADARDLPGTVVTPHLECPIADNTNVLWCATFQIAWNQLYDLLGGPIPDKAESDMVALLNQRRVTGDDLDEASYVALAGYATGGPDDIFERIGTALTEKFSGIAQPDLLTDLPPLGRTDWVAYAYLFKALPFEFAFTRNRNWGMAFSGRKVQTFGINQLLPQEKDEARMARQVHVYDYHEDDFIVELLTASKSDRLILAKVRPAPTLAETVRAVQARLDQAAPKGMAKYSDLRIPILDFDIKRHYGELRHIGWATQQIRFKLDETGAVLKSEAITVSACSQELVFDRPFLVLLQRVDARNPYFALWVANAELLVPVDETS